MINEMCVAISSALAVPEKAVKLTGRDHGRMRSCGCMPLMPLPVT